jgi:Domain of unknown function (DUF5666)
MRRMLFALPLAVLSIVGSPASSAVAQDARIARGVVTQLGPASLTVKVRGEEMIFNVDSRTLVEARGAGTRTQQALAASKSGVPLNELLRTGQAVAVTYRDDGSTHHASIIKAIPHADADGGSSADASLTSNGTVKTIAPGWLTIVGSSGGGAWFTQTFMVDGRTKVIAKGAGTAAASSGGKAAFTDLIANGDKVSVSYRLTSQGTLHASDVRVTTKAMH